MDLRKELQNKVTELTGVDPAETVNQLKVLTDVLRERDAQDDKWGVQDHDPSIWLMIIGEELGEANEAALDLHFDGDSYQYLRNELVQVAASAIAAIENLDPKLSEEHSE